jgi:hypothetical protein
LYQRGIKREVKVKQSYNTHCRRRGERRCSYYSFTTSALDGGECSASLPGCALPPEKGPPVSIGRRLGAPQSRSGHKAKSCPTSRHEGAWGSGGIAPAQTSAIDGSEWSASRPSRALAPVKGPPLPIVQEAGWALQPVWTQRLEEKSFRLCRGSNRDRPLVQFIARRYSLLTELPRLLIKKETERDYYMTRSSVIYALFLH